MTKFLGDPEVLCGFSTLWGSVPLPLCCSRAQLYLALTVSQRPYEIIISVLQMKVKFKGAEYKGKPTQVH